MGDINWFVQVDWRGCQATPITLRKGVAMILPKYTVWRLVCGEDSLVTMGSVVERGWRICSRRLWGGDGDGFWGA
jgi:hypothetical protein